MQIYTKPTNIFSSYPNFLFMFLFTNLPKQKNKERQNQILTLKSIMINVY